MERFHQNFFLDAPALASGEERRWLSQSADSQGNTLEFLLSPTRDTEAASRFFSTSLAASSTVTPRVITVDQNAAYPTALKAPIAAGLFQRAVNDARSVPQQWC